MTCRQVLRFYVERDIQPAKWYPKGETFDDLPAQFRGEHQSRAAVRPPSGRGAGAVGVGDHGRHRVPGNAHRRLVRK